MAKRSLVHIDLIKAVYKREAYVIQCFLAFSINCGENPNLRDFSLATPLKFGIGEEDAKDDQIVSLLKADYTAWIAAVGFGQLADLLSLLPGRCIHPSQHVRLGRRQTDRCAQGIPAI